jgi:hypothetical protein
MATKKVKITFEPVTAAQEHTITLTAVEYTAKGKRKVVSAFEGLPKTIVITKGEQIELPKEVFDALVEAGQVRTKKDMKAKEQLILDKTPLYEMEESDRSLMLFDLPYEA